ncbi:MAG TPA: hypothetical protein VNN20_02270 [Thermodesulfobacteriota bacterium]|nr:hypothetical protein [Thermodesulfobacteriota bacterium]
MIKKRQRIPNIRPLVTLPQKCTWCGKSISDEQEVFGLEAAVNPAYKNILKKAEGAIIPQILTLTEKIVHAVVVTQDSEVKREGFDILFIVCSEPCALMIEKALNQEQAIWEWLFCNASSTRWINFPCFTF